MSVNFSKYKENIVREVTAKYVFHDFEGKPWVEVRRGDRTNRPLVNAMLKSPTMSQGVNRRLRGNRNDLERTQEELINLYADHVITGWGGFTDDKGKAAAFTKAGARDLLAFLDSHDQENGTDWFNDFVEFVTNRESFGVIEADGEDLGKG